MKQRGYSPVASSNHENKQYYARSTDFGPLHAEVNLAKQTIALDCVELKLLCQLKTIEFNFFHNDFERFEEVIHLYAQKCLDLDVFKLLNELQAAAVPKEEKPSKKTLEDRKKAFWDKIRAAGKDKYEKDMALAFYNYWTEHNEGGKMMRFEKENTFNIAGRLTTWAKNEDKFTNTRKTFIDKKIEKQNSAIEESKELKINTKELF